MFFFCLAFQYPLMRRTMESIAAERLHKIGKQNPQLPPGIIYGIKKLKCFCQWKINRFFEKRTNLLINFDFNV
jgi:hypothetical protein